MNSIQATHEDRERLSGPGLRVVIDWCFYHKLTDDQIICAVGSPELETFSEWIDAARSYEPFALPAATLRRLSLVLNVSRGAFEAYGVGNQAWLRQPIEDAPLYGRRPLDLLLSNQADLGRLHDYLLQIVLERRRQAQPRCSPDYEPVTSAHLRFH